MLLQSSKRRSCSREIGIGAKGATRREQGIASCTIWPEPPLRPRSGERGIKMECSLDLRISCDFESFVGGFCLIMSAFVHHYQCSRLLIEQRVPHESRPTLILQTVPQVNITALIILHES